MRTNRGKRRKWVAGVLLPQPVGVPLFQGLQRCFELLRSHHCIVDQRGLACADNFPQPKHGVDLFVAGHGALWGQPGGGRQRFLALTDGRKAEHGAVLFVVTEGAGARADCFDRTQRQAGTLGNFTERVSAQEFENSLACLG